MNRHARQLPWEKIETRVKELVDSESPIAPRKLEETLKQQEGWTQGVIREAIWRLVNRGQLDFDREVRLVAGRPLEHA